MSLALRQEIDRLRQMILSLGTMSEESVRSAVLSIRNRDVELARRVIARDGEIDCAEIGVERETLNIIALHQPVAADLRFVIAVLEMNGDLERIADLAVNIAERALELAKAAPVELPPELPPMAERAQRMFKDSLDALVSLDAELARRVCAADDEVDELNRQAYDGVEKAIRHDPDNVRSYIALLSVCRHLERIADHATNIARDAIYMVEGEIVRHQTPVSSGQHGAGP